MRILVLLLLLAPAAAAYPDPAAAPAPPERPCLADYNRGFLYDYVGVFGPEFAQAVEADACTVYEATSAHFVLVTVPHTDGETIENYALHLFEAWGVGDEQRLDGVMLLYVANYLDAGGAVRIEVGYGLEAALSSAVTLRIFDAMLSARDEMLAYNLSEARALEFALAVGAEALLTATLDGYVDGGFPDPADPSPGPSILGILALVLLFGVVVAVLAVTSSRGSGSWGYTSHPQAWTGPSTRVFVGTVALEALRIGLGAAGGGGLGGGGFGGGRSGGGGKSGRF